ncbi:bifunctional ADP-dependent (S)-NAD(P)H-hydrate dehydratase/NAD(P)H-hydrate epimerase [Marinobacter salinus]|uniref:Bifunctional NAD(P)H-hydrate repair enzyme n=1 Tax=Marinobacter salinus TaxID=1874317 RepID=A0A1D9GHB7_9GAMM|nr:bifunctional ADP-dependent NAD(P)H-hydrate dehydratase/NAD(P)H-hydrate epimerase [Marinobacter salinus]AOY87036.1 bifunctional ADP-dependent (S)-NAD(P)H-hydrate dehydratase/NAD(P)H-hydrate epimerase [Marinobacter salinus]
MPPSAASSLPDALFSADAVREIDRYVIEQQGVDGFDLMQRAAHAAFRRLVRDWHDRDRILVLCGAGNNGGDGYLVAANARRHGLNVDCIAVAPTRKLAGDARKAWQKAVADGVGVRELKSLDEVELDRMFGQAGLLVDAMLGTGVSGAPREPFAEMIGRCNGAGVPVLAVDLPSGLNATTGAAEGEVVRAAVTVTFIGLKAGLFTGQGAAVCGKVVFESLDAGQGVAGSGQQSIATRLDWSSTMSWLPERPANAHKGRFGHVLVVAGDRGFGGAGLLAAEAAMRSGAGLVSLATRPEHVTAALGRCPSVMVHGLIHGSELPPLLEAATVIVCGPGIGRSAWGQQMLEKVVASGKPRVLDADALNLLANRVAVPANNHILTPHPGEAARLLNCLVPEVEADRMAAAAKLQSIFGGTVLLKGAGTVIASESGGVDIVSGSNPGMATGGMGDVLSGIIGALYAQLGDSGRAAGLGASVHLAAANLASETRGFVGLIPNDVIDALPLLFCESEKKRARSWEGK